jgi:hypothetical protein
VVKKRKFEDMLSVRLVFTMDDGKDASGKTRTIRPVQIPPKPKGDPPRKSPLTATVDRLESRYAPQQR